MNLDVALADPFVARLRSALATRAPQQGIYSAKVRMAAVALLLRLPQPEMPEVLLIKRATYESDPWSGHVALPGGRQEEGDRDLRETAVRETREELAIDVDSDGHVLGLLDDVVPSSPRLPPIVIRPYVGIVTASLLPVLSHEVAAAFWIPLERIRDPGARVRTVVNARGVDLDVDGYQLGEHLIWGLTERILRNFFELLDG